MPSVTINANNAGNPNPNPAPCTGSDQTITWNLVPSAASFASAPIKFPNPPPAGYNPWPGGSVTVSGNTATANVNRVMGPGQRQKYKYTVVLANGTEFDPDIENTGSGPMDEGKHPKKA
jgi:hypothetical protein